MILQTMFLGLLDKINFYDGKDELDSDLIDQFVTKSIGGNPRSIKRLINSLALIKILNEKDAEDSSDGCYKRQRYSYGYVCYGLSANSTS